MLGAGCDDGPRWEFFQPPPLDPAVTVTPDTLSLFVGASTTLKAVVTHDTMGVQRGVTWASTMPQVATVSTTGFVTAVSPGATTIIATSNFRPAKAAASSVVVMPLPTECMMLVAPSTAAIVVGAKVQLIAPGCVGAITWLSSNAAVATVSATGEVIGLKGGVVTILARAAADSRLSATSQITVVEQI